MPTTRVVRKPAVGAVIKINLTVWQLEDSENEMNVLEKRQRDEFMEEEAQRFHTNISLAKSEGVPYNVPDGCMRERFEGVAA